VGWNGGGAGDADYAAAFDLLLLPLYRAFDPDLIVVSAGFDSARGDPLGGCDLTPAGYARLTHGLLGLKPKRGIAFALEGGYNCLSVARSYAACVGALLGAAPPPPVEGKPTVAALKAVLSTAECLAPHWPKALKKPLKKCAKKYAKAHAKRVAERGDDPEPQVGPGFGWAFRD